MLVSLRLLSPLFSMVVTPHGSLVVEELDRGRGGVLYPPFFFLLITQNLSVILKKALAIDLVQGFNNNLHKNFNHLMFTDDLILITNASRKIARNCLMCLNPYHYLRGQKSNPTKSNLFLPSWCNQTLARGIFRILGISQGSFPFTYLGDPISPKRLLASHFNSITSKV